MSAHLVHPYFVTPESAAISLSQRDVVLSDAEGNVVFEQKKVIAPKDWSDTAVKIAASKYFAGPTKDVPQELLHKLNVDEDVARAKIKNRIIDNLYRYYVNNGYDDPYEKVEALIESGELDEIWEEKDAQKSALLEERESSVVDLVERVATTIADAGMKRGYFHNQEERGVFWQELRFLLLTQRVAFNSPVWFNIGAYRNGQGHACFIQSVDDDMEDIADLSTKEIRLFKQGSGTGTNFSTLRSSHEKLSTGGKPSGPCSFMKFLDAGAGCIKSGGRTRRSAKMSVLNIDHPDVDEFINLKTKEEHKARALLAAGFSNGMDGEAYSTVAHQNCNYSVRVTDDFMRAVEEDKDWELLTVIDRKPVRKMKARELWKMIAQAAWDSGDPGLQFDDMIDKYHTCANDGRQTSTNPCGEYLFLDETACNLASFNLMKFYCQETGEFLVEDFKAAVRVIFLAQDILIDFVGYPSYEIACKSKDYRTIGMGYANLGALLMAMGLPYDSDEGRSVAAAITSLMGGEAYKTSATIAQRMGPFPRFPANKHHMLEVMDQHRMAWPIGPGKNHGITVEYPERIATIRDHAKQAWEDAIAFGEAFGFRNAQATLLAPTGTIALFMDCDTTGIEPALGLVTYKKLAGGGMMQFVNQTTKVALKALGYDDKQIDVICKHIQATGNVVGCDALKDDHIPVFATALDADNQIEPLGHVRMMAAVQPFLSGGISKTVNCPSHWTAEDIAEIYMQSWKMGLKCIAVYRDGCKGGQPLTTGKEKKAEKKEERPRSGRYKLPTDRQAVVHKFEIGGHSGFVTVGLYQDGKPGELFINMSKEGSTMSGLMDCWAKAVSMMLQWGVPLDEIVANFKAVSFPPQGLTMNQNIRMAQSPIDYICRLLEYRYVIGRMPEIQERHGIAGDRQAFQIDSPPCSNCGAIMFRAGSCYMCRACGDTGGCS